MRRSPRLNEGGESYVEALKTSVREPSSPLTASVTTKSADISNEDFQLLKKEVELLKQENKILQLRILDFENLQQKVTELERKFKHLEKTNKGKMAQESINICSTQIIESVSEMVDKKNQELQQKIKETRDTFESKVKAEIEGQLNNSVSQLMNKQLLDKQSEMHGSFNGNLGSQIEEEVKEQQARLTNTKKLRIGGLAKNWWTDKSCDNSITEGIYEVTPFINWNKDKVTGVTRIGSHVIVTFDSQEARLEVLKQTNKLKGTEIWMVEELTRKQLEQKTTEMDKVKKARKEGKWAVYRGGIALIRDFRPK